MNVKLNKAIELAALYMVVAFTQVALAQSAVTNPPGFQLQFISNAPLKVLPPVTLSSVSPLPATTSHYVTDILTQIPTNDPGEIIPQVVFQNVPLTTAIENLARLAHINYLIDPELEQARRISGEPTTTLRWQKIKASQALKRLLGLYHLDLVEDPASNIAYILPARQKKNPSDAEDSVPTNAKPAIVTNGLIPQIIFDDVPLTTALENLARLANINYLIDQELCDSWEQRGPDPTPEPVLSLRFEDVTARNAMERILAIRGIALWDDEVTHVTHIIRSDKVLPEVNYRLLGVADGNLVSTNGTLPQIQFSDVPVDVALKELVRLTSLPVKIDPQVQSVIATDEGRPRIISLRWQNITPNQVLAALCRNYGLDIVKDAATDEIWIKPRKVKRQHHLRFR